MIDFGYSEGATPIEPDEAEGLLLTHITTHGELNRWEQDNIVEALAWMARTEPTNILNEQFLKQLHKRMFGNVWKWAGRFRRSFPIAYRGIHLSSSWNTGCKIL